MFSKKFYFFPIFLTKINFHKIFCCSGKQKIFENKTEAYAQFFRKKALKCLSAVFRQSALNWPVRTFFIFFRTAERFFLFQGLQRIFMRFKRIFAVSRQEVFPNYFSLFHGGNDFPTPLITRHLRKLAEGFGFGSANTANKSGRRNFFPNHNNLFRLILLQALQPETLIQKHRLIYFFTLRKRHTYMTSPYIHFSGNLPPLHGRRFNAAKVCKKNRPAGTGFAQMKKYAPNYLNSGFPQALRYALTASMPPTNSIISGHTFSKAAFFHFSSSLSTETTTP